VAAHRESLSASGAPAVVGPYVHAVRAGGLLFCSGQIPLDPESGELVGATPAEQLRRCLENLETVCRAAGTGLSDAARVTIYLLDIAALGEVNAAYAAFFPVDPPARFAFAVAGLPRGAEVALDAVIALPE